MMVNGRMERGVDMERSMMLTKDCCMMVNGRME